MQKETRPGLRRFIPFMREKTNVLDAPKEEIKDGELKIPANAYSKDGTAKVSVVTYGTNGEWTTTVAFSGSVIGLNKSTGGSMDEALLRETEFMDEKTNVVKFDPIEFDYGDIPVEKRIKIKDYSQRAYLVKQKDY